MEKKISTAEGILLRVNRSIQAEGVFAAIKEDLNFRRFLTRGNANVTVEWYLVSMAYYFSHTHTAPPGCGSEADVSDASPPLENLSACCENVYFAARKYSLRSC